MQIHILNHTLSIKSAMSFSLNITVDFVADGIRGYIFLSSTFPN